MITVTQNIQASAVGARGFGGNVTEVGSYKVELDNIFQGASVNAPQAGSFIAADVQSIMLVSSQNLTLKTNDATTPGDTIELKANIPLFWSKSAGYFDNPFTSDVTGFFVTCAAAARLQMLILS
ncbi:hypothetical protein [Singulisphaera sp. PoT]|uniref:hypothetical protein n=1 Tax=Singulisphaera sp. PoT TaxID=3411797 RepID=UPI003BF4793E